MASSIPGTIDHNPAEHEHKCSACGDPLEGGDLCVTCEAEELVLIPSVGLLCWRNKDVDCPDDIDCCNRIEDKIRTYSLYRLPSGE